MLNTIAVTPEESWQDILINAVKDLSTLLQHLGLHADQIPVSKAAMADFPLRVPRPFLNRIEPGNPHDPLLLQVLPLLAETLEFNGYSADPLQEERFNPHPGLLQKYHGRALLVTTATCAVHCRYCFRRHFPYTANNPGRNRWRDTLETLREDSSVTEVILSGGDPLALADRQLQWLIAEVGALPHVQRLRIHTRLPIMIPQRVNRDLCNMLNDTRLHTVVVIHANHAQEFDPNVDAACRRLRETGALLLNQSVLLKGINDNADTLALLSERLFSAGVLPYYLHLPDKTRGTAHFDVSQRQALTIMHCLQARLPGYLVPKLVREIPGEAGKTQVT